ncbi:MAG TPA: TrmH family RNA methyltransferase [Saprospiraceae bacterium]|nr:TrmH family RNA methyltransferase [Saprospiraceae bacterium]
MRKKLQLHELNRLDIQAFSEAPKFRIRVIAENIRSAMNVGSFFRTSDAFAIEKLILTGITAKPPHREITKTAIGATESVEWEHVDSIHPILEKSLDDGYTLIAVEQTNESIPLDEFKVLPDGKYILVFGNEVEGVSDQVIAKANQCIEIPQYGTKHSLNVTVCVGIVLWEFVSQMTR